MSKFFKKKSTIQIPDSTKQEILPRQQDEIDKEYTQLCISIGDRTVKVEGMKEELQQMFNYARKLGAESARRQELNKATAESIQSRIPPQNDIPDVVKPAEQVQT